MFHRVRWMIVVGMACVAAGCGDDEGDPSGNADGGMDANSNVDASTMLPDARLIDASIPDAQGILGEGDRCDQSADAGVGCGAGLLCCKPCCDGRPAVCTAPSQNAAGIGVGQCPLPDLRMEEDRLVAEVGLGNSTFTSMGCTVQEGCVDAAGTRKLLHFSVVSSNVGTADLIMGDPTNNPNFSYHMCHDHYHFGGYALYRLLDSNGVEVMQGRKRAFCLEDFERMDNPPLGARLRQRYTCANQGISMGWADTYANGLTCQFMDVTTVAPGTYTLEVHVNPDRYFEELRYDNNIARATVVIPATSSSPLDACMGQIEGINRECGFTAGGNFSCTAGQQVTVGCGSRCGVGTCSGDTIMRVCDGTTPCAYPGLGVNDDCNGSTNCSAVRFMCPTSGQYNVMWAPFLTTGTAMCNLGTL